MDNINIDKLNNSIYKSKYWINKNSESSHQNDIYKSKYYKYKNKYLALKQIAGATNIPDDWEDEDFELPPLNSLNIQEAAPSVQEATITSIAEPIVFADPVLILTFEDGELPIDQEHFNLLVKDAPFTYILETMIEFPEETNNGIPVGKLDFLVNTRDMIRIINMLKSRKIDYDTSINYDKYKNKITDTNLLFDLPDPRIRLKLSNRNIDHKYFLGLYDFEGNINNMLKKKLNKNLEIKQQDRILIVFNNSIIDDILVDRMRLHPFKNKITDVNIQQFFASTAEIMVKSLNLSNAGSKDDALRIIKYLKTGNFDYDDKVTYSLYTADPSGKLIYDGSTFTDNRVVWSGNKTDATFFAKMNKNFNVNNTEFLNILTNKLNKVINISLSKRISIEKQESDLYKKINKSISDEPKRNRKRNTFYDDEDEDYNSDYVEDSYLQQKIIAFKKDIANLEKKSRSKKSRSQYSDLSIVAEEQFRANIYQKHFGLQFKLQFPNNIFEELTKDEKRFLKVVPNLLSIYYLTPNQEKQIN